MTNETKQRIEAYKKALPEMKERVAAVAILLVMSISMMASATFAWLTLSRSPEVTGMQTTVAANGNLEIALAQGLTKDPIVAPRESMVGDSSATEGKKITDANVTWGNLVNVSDPVYGISNIALRPALLSAYNRTDYPLNGATYGIDGRVVTTNDRYEFASYALVDGTDNQYYFAAGDKVNYGVRAISSVGYQNLSGNIRIDNFRNDTNQLYMEAQNFYGQIVAEEPNDVNTLDDAAGVTCISALEGLVTVFAQDRINQMGYGPNGDAGKTSETSCSPYLWYTYQMMLRLQEALTKEGKAILEMANWQAYVASGDAQRDNTFASIEDVIEASKQTTTVDGKTMTVLASKGVTLTTLKDYINSVEGLDFCINGNGSENYPGIKPMAEKCKNPDSPEEEFFWDDISVYINELVEINSTTMNGKKLSDINGVGDAVDILGGGDVIVYKGILKDTELRMVNNDNRVSANVKVTVKTNIPFMNNTTVPGTVYTDAYGKEPTYSVDLAYSDALQSGAKGDATAKDTYGLALDVWVRTNYPNAVLTLEGSAKYEDQEATITVDDKEYKLYTISVGEGETKTEVDVYQKEDVWYYANTMVEVSSEDMGSQTPKEKLVPVIVGYEGENRVWEDWRELLEGGYIEQDATTQGAGSCFVFYADTPTEQAKIMEMLEAFNVAFMDQNGDILGAAKLNLDSAYANQGKVTVPLEVDSGVDYTDESGMSHKGITNLTQNTPTLITAIVYLNGSKLQNENVLAEGELQGQLNIQFGTDSTLIAPDNEELQAQARTITAEVTVNGQTISNGIIGDTNSNGTIDDGEGLEYIAEGYPAKVVLTVEGDQPERISGFFVRVINSTQGTRGEEKNFTYNTNTKKWEAEFTLTNPGTYAFNTLLVDGVQYILHDGSEQSGINKYYPPNRPYVHIQGLRVLSATVTGVAPGTHMTAASSMAFPVTVKLESAVMPKQVNAQFFNEDNTKQYTAILTYDTINDQWVGTANISSSDTYTLKYISVDGDTLDAPAAGSYTLYLGLRASVSTSVPEEDREFFFIGQARQFGMTARIYDDGGKPIENLSNIKLYYNNIISPATMTWNGTYYEGVLDGTRPGQMSFNRLELGSAGTINNVSGAPIFMAISLEKPTYVSGEAKHAKATVIGSDLVATMSVLLENGESAVVWAETQKTVNGNTELRYIEGTRENAENQNEITFTLPKEDGDWTLKRLFLQNVYDKDAVYENSDGSTATGRWYAETAETPTENDSFILLPNESDKLSTDVVADYNVAVYYDGVEKGNYSSTDNKSTVDTFTIDLTNGTPGAFLTEYTTKAITVEVTDYKNRKIDTMTTSGSQLQLTYDATTSDTYGGYTGASSDVIEYESITASDKTVSLGTVKLKQAGVYNTTAFKISLGTAGMIDVKVRPKFTIRSVKPTVTITAVSPTNTYSVDKNTTGTLDDTVTQSNPQQGTGCDSGKTYYDFTWNTNNNHKTNYQSLISSDKLTATVYFKCYHTDNTTYSGGTKKENAENEQFHAYWDGGSNVGNPSVTLKLEGISNYSRAELSFNDNTHIYKQVGTTETTWTRTRVTQNAAIYSWETGVTTCMRYIGYSSTTANKAWGGADTVSDASIKTAAGELTANQLIVTYGDVKYTFTIPTVKIINPH